MSKLLHISIVKYHIFTSEYVYTQASVNINEPFKESFADLTSEESVQLIVDILEEASTPMFTIINACFDCNIAQGMSRQYHG